MDKQETAIDRPQPTIVSYHATALCESDLIGAGTRVWAFTHIMSGARLGTNCNVCDHVFIESGVEIGDRVTIKNRAVVFNGVTIADDVFVGPAVVFTNDRFPRSARMSQAAPRYAKTSEWLERTFVDQGASIGAGAVVLCGIRIGAYASIGAGAIVTHDVPPHALVVGQPARQAGWVCMCGEVLPDTLVCRRCAGAFTSDGHSISAVSDSPGGHPRIEHQDHAVVLR